MKRLCCISILLCIMAGCASVQKITPEKSWQIASETYLSTMNLMVQYRGDGFISDEDYMKIESIRINARLALNLMGAASTLDNQTLLDQSKSDFTTAIEELIKYLETARKEKTNGPGNNSGSSSGA